MSLAARFLDRLLRDRDLAGAIAHREDIPPRPARETPLPGALAPPLRAGLAALGIDRLWTHQAAAIRRALAGEDVVVVTPTASGKTLCYNLPVLQRCAADPAARALYLFPIKALGQDQLGAFRELAAACGLEGQVRAEIYDGDTSAHRRAKIRAKPPSVIVSNPDMLHVGLLAFHEKWEELFANLAFVVLDEVHTYRGVFGSHVANLLRRLLRVAAHYGSRPQVIACSGTIANPGELAGRLTGREPAVVEENGAPEAGRHFLFVNPTTLAPATLASRLLRDAVREDLATIVFTKARRTTELVYTWAVHGDARLRKLVSAYRAGYLPEERREIEERLFTGKLKGVVSTSALEMGIDIGALDACILVGYPGSVAATWQRGGRVGRQDRESLIVLIAGQDALDQYFMKHPRAFFDAGFEPAVVNPGNHPVLEAHLRCAAAELPLRAGDPWLADEEAVAAVGRLERAGDLVRAVGEDAWHCVRRSPQREVNIRGIGESYTIFLEPGAGAPAPPTPPWRGGGPAGGAEEPEQVLELPVDQLEPWVARAAQGSGKRPRRGRRAAAEELPAAEKPRVIGSLDGTRAWTEGHPGAIYLHRAEQYQVTRLDLGRRNLWARPVDVNYFTLPHREKETEILAVQRSRLVGNFVCRRGELRVTERVVGYEKKRVSTGERLSVHELDLPPFSFETVGFWIEIDDFIRRAVEGRAPEGRPLGFMGGIHALEHAAIALFPLFALCERDDVGGISIPLHPQVGKGAVFFYDGYAGGVGLAEACFERIADLLERTLALISECSCEGGCPACIYSSKCGSGNVPLDKEAARTVLALLLDRPESHAWRDLAPAGEEPEPPPEPEAPGPEPVFAAPRVMVLDLETLRSADEVGGWGNAHLMGAAVTGVWDSREERTRCFAEGHSAELLALLREADVVVGFNIRGFDLKVLSAYDDGTLGQLPVFDILEAVRAQLGFRLSLGHLAEHTLGEGKTADGLQSLRWVREGRLDLVEEYCRADVRITTDLFRHGLEAGWLRYLSRDGTLVQLSVQEEWRKRLARLAPKFTW